MTLALPSMLQTLPTTPTHEIHQAAANRTIAYPPAYLSSYPVLLAAFTPQCNTLSATTDPLKGSGDEHGDLLLGSDVVGCTHCSCKEDWAA
jgi:hypothetical protein